MWGQADLKKTRAYQEVEQEGRRAGREEVRQEILQITVPLLLEKGMTIEEIAQHYKLQIEILQKFSLRSKNAKHGNDPNFGSCSARRVKRETV